MKNIAIICSIAVLGVMLTACGKVKNIEQRPAAECKAWAEYETYDTITVDSIDDVPESCKAICLNNMDSIESFNYEDEEEYYYSHDTETMFACEFPTTDCFEYIVNVAEGTEAETLQKLAERDLTRAAFSGVDITDFDALSHMEHLESLWIACADFTPKFKGTFPALTDLYVMMSNVETLGDIPNIITLQRLTLCGTDIHSAKGLEKLTNLAKLDLSYTHLRSLKPLATMTQLTALDLAGQTTYNSRCVPDLQYVAVMQNLRTLGLSFNKNGIKHVELLAELTALEHLCLLECNLKSAEPLEPLTQLKALDLTANHINDIEPLTGMTSLEKLRLHNNEIVDLLPLAGMTQMRVLYIGYNDIIDISPISGMTQMEHFDAYGCANLQSIEALRKMPNLKILDLSGVKHVDPDVLAAERNLEELHLEGVEQEDWGFLGNFSDMQLLNVSKSNVEDVSAIVKLRNLHSLNISLTEIRKIDGISALSSLDFLNISGTDIDDIQELRKMDSLTSVEAESMRRMEDEKLAEYKKYLEEKGGSCMVSIPIIS